MAKQIAIVNTSTDSFSTFITRTNELINAVNTEVITANTNANGAITQGNSFLYGIFGANTLTVFNSIRGGNVQTSNVLYVTSNLYVNSSLTTIGNSTVNTTSNGWSLSVANATATAILSYTGLSVSGNAGVNSTTFFVGNTTANVLLNSSSLTVSNSTGSVVLNPNFVTFGNSTINAIANSVLFRVANSTASANLSVGGVTVGTSVVNSTVIAAGSQSILGVNDLRLGTGTVNTIANSSMIKIANSTVSANLEPGKLSIGNVVVNTTSVYISGAALVTEATRDSVYVDGALVANAKYVHFKSGTNVQLNAAYEAGNNAVAVTINAVATSGSAIIGGAGISGGVQFNTGDNFDAVSEFVFNKTTKTLTVSNTTVTNTAQLAFGIVMAANQAAFVASDGPDTIDAFPIASFRTVDYVYSVKNDSANAYQGGKLVVINDGTAGHVEEYAVGTTNGVLGMWLTSQNSTHILVQFDPVSPLSYTCKVQKTCIPV